MKTQLSVRNFKQLNLVTSGLLVVVGLLGSIGDTWVSAMLTNPPTITETVLSNERGHLTTVVGGDTTTYRIDEPYVKGNTIGYQEITFDPGDKVVIEAGGCVQTGGHGDTWKRYVNPSGRNSDHLYWGTILIPGLAGGVPGSSHFPPIRSVMGRSWTVPAGPKLTLSLGYEDDDYTDNGYWSHDDGNDDQCKGVGDAFVIITKTKSVVPPPAAVFAPFELVFNDPQDSFDHNGLLLNPVWGWQKGGLYPEPPQLSTDARAIPEGCSGYPWEPPCTNQQPVNEDNWWGCKYFSWTQDCCDLDLGHRNWAAATYTGNIFWDSYSGDDDDYNLRFFPSQGGGLIANNEVKSYMGGLFQGRTMEMEFNSYETINLMGGTWWDSFHKAVNKGNQAAMDLIDGQYAIMTGLVGLDCAHSTCATELHPIWALAVRVKLDPTQYAPTDEMWAMFVRRWGDEGFCSTDQHLLDLPTGNTYTFHLPWRPTATDVEVERFEGDFHTFTGQATGPTIQSAKDEGITVSFTVPPADFPVNNEGTPTTYSGEMVYGNLLLHWKGVSAPSPVPAVVPSTRGIEPRVTEGVKETDKGEHRVAELIKRMSPTQRMIFEARRPQKSPPRQLKMPIQPGPPHVKLDHLIQKNVTAFRNSPYSSHTRSAIDPQKVARNKQYVDALRAALPDLKILPPGRGQ